MLEMRHFTQRLKSCGNKLTAVNRQKIDILGQGNFEITQKFRFLGFQVSTDGNRPDPDSCSAIAEMPAPRTAKDVCRFLGAAEYFRRHNEGFANISAPLTDLTKKYVLGRLLDYKQHYSQVSDNWIQHLNYADYFDTICRLQERHGSHEVKDRASYIERERQKEQAALQKEDLRVKEREAALQNEHTEHQVAEERVALNRARDQERLELRRQ
nr:uncharacterized protein LOC123749419 [Procambarus clarkii]